MNQRIVQLPQKGQLVLRGKKVSMKQTKINFSENFYKTTLAPLKRRSRITNMYTPSRKYVV